MCQLRNCGSSDEALIYCGEESACLVDLGCGSIRFDVHAHQKSHQHRRKAKANEEDPRHAGTSNLLVALLNRGEYDPVSELLEEMKVDRTAVRTRRL
jgi:hypothetical protein